MNEGSARARHIEVLVAPLVIFGAVVILLLVARSYEKIPLRMPECGFRSSFGIPCVSCGGTRSMRALASGRIVEAIRFNPALVFGVFVSLLWFFRGWYRFLRGYRPHPIPEQNRRIKRIAILAICLLALNWIYLILFLK